MSCLFFFAFLGLCKTRARTVERDIGVCNFPVRDEQEGQGSCQTEHSRSWTTEKQQSFNLIAQINIDIDYSAIYCIYRHQITTSNWTFYLEF